MASVDDVLRLVESGLTKQVDVAEELGITTQAVYALLRRAGLQWREVVRGTSQVRLWQCPTCESRYPDEGCLSCDRVAAIDLWRQGFSRAEVARQISRSESFVGRVTKDVTGGPGMVATQQASDSVVRYQQGETIEQIAKSLGRSGETVSRWIKDAGVEVLRGVDRMTPEQIREWSRKGNEGNRARKVVRYGECEQCGEIFQKSGARNRQRYCTRECSYKARSDPSKRSVYTCIECGRDFEWWTNTKAPRQYCSTECKGRSLPDRLRVGDVPLDSSYEAYMWGKVRMYGLGIERVDRTTEAIVTSEGGVYAPDFKVHVRGKWVYVDLKGEHGGITKWRQFAEQRPLVILNREGLMRLDQLSSGTQIMDFLDGAVFDGRGVPSEVDVPKDFIEWVGGLSMDRLDDEAWTSDDLAVIYRHLGVSDKHELRKRIDALPMPVVVVWQDDWLGRNSVVKRMVEHKMGLSVLPRVYARSTKVVSLDMEANRFLDVHHIQGAGLASVKMGLEYEDSLVAVMTLQPESRTWRLDRYATSAVVVGGFTKLLSAFIREHDPERIVTFADRTISDGRLYEQSGFTMTKLLDPDYKYIRDGQREHKFGYRLERFRRDPSLLYEDGLSESQLAELNGLPRVWDAGKQRWEWVRTLSDSLSRP